MPCAILCDAKRPLSYKLWKCAGNKFKHLKHRSRQPATKRSCPQYMPQRRLTFTDGHGPATSWSCPVSHCYVAALTNKSHTQRHTEANRQPATCVTTEYLFLSRTPRVRCWTRARCCACSPPSPRSAASGSVRSHCHSTLAPLHKLSREAGQKASQVRLSRVVWKCTRSLTHTKRFA